MVGQVSSRERGWHNKYIRKKRRKGREKRRKQEGKKEKNLGRKK